MELKLANHSSYPRIGDNAEGQLLRRTIAQWERKEKSDADLHSAEDEMTTRALQEQSDAGLDLVTDGLIRWYDPVSHLAGKLEGVRINGLLRFFDTNFYFRQPVVTGPIRRTKPLLVDEFKFAQSHSSKPVKVVLTGPYTLARLSVEEGAAASNVEKLLDAYTAALAEEVAALSAAGAKFIQLDEPSLLRYPAGLPLLSRSLATLAQIKRGARLSLSLFFGDPAPLYEKLQALPVDQLSLDFTYNPKLAGDISAAGSSKPLGLGLVDGRNTKLEDVRTTAQQIGQILSRVSGESAYLQPSCGLEYLPRDRAQMKLKHLATIQKTFLGKNA